MCVYRSVQFLKMFLEVILRIYIYAKSTSIFGFSWIFIIFGIGHFAYIYIQQINVFYDFLINFRENYEILMKNMKFHFAYIYIQQIHVFLWNFHEFGQKMTKFHQNSWISFCVYIYAANQRFLWFVYDVLLKFIKISQKI